MNPTQTAIDATIAAEIGARPEQVASAVALLDGGATVPFVARYRKEQTGGLDDGQLRTLENRLQYLRDLETRREAVLRSIGEQGKLTPELEAQVRGAATRAALEAVYLPYRSKRQTKADLARENGLAPLADTILADRSVDPAALATSFLNDRVADAKAALDGAREIVAERIAAEPVLGASIRTLVTAKGRIRSDVDPEKAQSEAGQKFRDYFDHSEKWSDAPSHRVLALLRARNEGVVSLRIDVEEPEAAEIEAMIARKFGIRPKEASAADAWLSAVSKWAWKVKIHTRLTTQMVDQMRERAEAEAIRVFSRNLRDLLLAPPAGAKVTMALDPGIAHGVKVAVVDGTGRILETGVVHPFRPRNDVRGASATLAGLIRKHGVELVAIGNGTASRETDKLAADVISTLPGAKPTRVIVSEAGASVYSASEAAAREMPDLDTNVRSAVSIGRRLQDPLAELIKVDPKAIGVGQYQHDVDQAGLSKALDGVVEDAVTAVGVDLNMASAALLSRVAGVGPNLADAIVAHRDANGPFRTRRKLLDVPRLGPKAFEQCAGFLRIRGGDEPLDASAVHPEAYPVAKRIVAATGKDVRSLMGDAATLRAVDAARFVGDGFGLPTVRDIVAELEKPGRDPRPSFKTATFSEEVHAISDLEPGMRLEGTVTNVAAFGAFVDIGVHQDGLVHISQLSDTFVKDPSDKVSVGQVVSVRVLEVDVPRKRISLSMKTKVDPADGQQPREAKGGRQELGRSPAKPQARAPEQGAFGAALAAAMNRR